MTAPNTYFAYNTVFKLDGSAGTLVALEGVQAAVAGLDRGKQLDGSTVLSQRVEDHTVGIEEPGEVSINGPYNTTILRHMAGIWNATADQTFEYNPGGTTTGKRKGSVETVMTGFELSWDLSSTIQVSTSHKCSGAWTFADN